MGAAGCQNGKVPAKDEGPVASPRTRPLESRQKQTNKQICSRIFRLIEKQFICRPELCESEYASFAFVGHGLYPDTNISLVDLATLPRYLRFGIVAIKFDASSLHEISIKCALIQNLLPLFAADKFINSRLQISCKIDHNDATSFSDPSMLLNCLANDVLPIFPSCRAFKFIIRSDKIAETSVLAPILQFSHINRCSNVCFWFCTEARRPPPTQLPTETISHWLNRSCGGCKGEGKHPAKERCLEIYTKSKWENIHEQCDCLKKVAPILQNKSKIPLQMSKNSFFSVCA